MKRMGYPLTLLMAAMMPIMVVAEETTGNERKRPATTTNPSSPTTQMAQAELKQCEDRIASVRREVLNRYETALDELQQSLQKAADLEGALAVRAERQRVAKTNRLTEEDFAGDFPQLRTVQAQAAAKLQELVAQLVAESSARLQEMKRSLTVSGDLDAAVEARAALDKLQTRFLPLSTPDPAVPVAVSTLLRLYAADRVRTDEAFKGKAMALRGIVAGFRPNPADARQYFVYLAESGGQGWLQCQFSAQDYSFREDRQAPAGGVTLQATGGGATVRLQRGVPLEVIGECGGWGDPLIFTRCKVKL